MRPAAKLQFPTLTLSPARMLVRKPPHNRARAILDVPVNQNYDIRKTRMRQQNVTNWHLNTIEGFWGVNS
jgi:hypothetical protein